MTDPEIHSDPDTTEPVATKGAALRLPRSRGVVSGVLLALAGAWGALAPFVGPYFDFAYTPKPGQTWHWTAARGWYEVLPGGLAVFGGLLLIVSAHRLVTTFGAVLAAVAGGWFVVGQQVSYLLTLGSPGAPAARGDRRYVAEYLAFFTGLGALIIFFAALALGRLSVRSVRDARVAARRDQDASVAEEQAAERQAEFERADADRAVTDRNAGAWAAGEQHGGYGTPGSQTPRAGEDQPSSAVTTELPVAGATAAAGATAWSEREHEHEHPDADPAAAHPAGPDDDTAAMPIASEPAVEPEPEPEPQPEPEPEPVQPEPEPVQPEPAPVQLEPVQPEPEPVQPEPAQPEPELVQPELVQPEPVQPEPVQPEPVQPEPPLVLEPPEGHPDAQRLRAATAPRAPEPAPSAPGAGATWNPEAQSPTTTGELPAVGTATPPPSADADAPPAADTPPYRRGIQQPRRYFGPGNPAQADDVTAAAPEAPTIGATVAPTGEPDRNTVRTDEADDLDDMDLDERPN